MLMLLILAKFFISDYCKRLYIQSRVVMWQLVFFLSRNRSNLPDERFAFSCFDASGDDDKRSLFIFLVHAILPKRFPALNDNANGNETISFW
jgi:hypothetical protein